jgi:hypothetical protein
MATVIKNESPNNSSRRSRLALPAALRRFFVRERTFCCAGSPFCIEVS